MDHRLSQLNRSDFELAISQSQSDELLNWHSTIMALRNLESLFDIVAESMRAFEALLLDAALQEVFVSSHRKDVASLRSRFGDVQRRSDTAIMTLLTAARSYHDQRGRLVNSISSLRAHSDAIEGPYRCAYDRSLDYRVMEVLRNYAQHHGLPTHDMRIDSAWQDDPSDAAGTHSRRREVVVPVIDRDRFLANEKVRKKLCGDLNRLTGMYLDMRSCARAYVSELAACHLEMRRTTELICADAIAGLQKARAQFSDAVPQGFDLRIEWLFLWRRGDGGQSQQLWLGPTLGEELIAARQRWEGLRYLRSRYVSSEVISMTNVQVIEADDIHSS